jgi:hypothetical protein
MPDFRVKVTVDSREGAANLGDLAHAEDKAGSSAKHSAELTLEYKEALNGLKEAAHSAFAVLGVGFGVEEILRTSIEATGRFEKALGQVEAGIKSTGGAAGLSSSELQELADRGCRPRYPHG